MKFEAKQISTGYNGIDIVKNVSFSLESGDVVCLLGPNGVGKTTLFKSLLGFLPLSGGEISIDGRPLCHDDRKAMASLIGYVPQVHEPPFPFQVRDVVVMGGIAKMNLFTGPSQKAYQRADELLELLEVSYLRDRIYTEISGGERQMVLIARALMQNPQFLMMDEPTSNLDFGNQMRVLQQIRHLAGRGVGILMTSHFPDHAFLCCTKAAVMCRNRPFQVGPVQEIVTEETLKNAYGISVKIAYINTPEQERKTIKTCVPLLETIRQPAEERISHDAAS